MIANPDSLPVTKSVMGPTRFKALILRNFGLVGKDLIRFPALLTLMFGSTLLVLSIPWLTANAPKRSFQEESASSAWAIFQVMMILVSYLLGLVMTVEEREGNTLRFLAGLPIRRSGYLVRRIVSGCILLTAWIVLTGLAIGQLSGHGVDIFRVFYESVAGATMLWNFGTSWKAGLLQLFAVFLTGFTSGLLLPGIISAAVVGLLSYSLWWGVLAIAYSDNPRGVSSIAAASFLWQAIWVVICLAAYGVAYRRALLADSGGGASRGVGLLEKIGSLVRGLGSNRSYDSPENHLLRGGALILGVILFALPIFFAVRNISAAQAIMLAPIAGALLGVNAWNEEERHCTRNLIYALPASREKILWARMRAVLGYGSILGLAGLLGFVVVLVFEERSLLDQLRSFEAVAYLILIFGVPLLAAVGGMLFRLFFRSKLAACILVIVLVVLATISVLPDPQITEAWLRSGQGSWLVIQALWTVLVAFGLPIATAWIAFCRSTLLEQSEAVRGRLAVALALFLVVWGGFLLSTNLHDLYVILLG